MNLHRVVLNSLSYKLLNKGIYITALLQTFPFSPSSPFIFFWMRIGQSPFDPSEPTQNQRSQMKTQWRIVFPLRRSDEEHQREGEEE